MNDTTNSIESYCFNPEGSAIRIVQLKMLEMIKFLDKICKDNDIPYILDGGSALGAIRHQGFIPWDDDMDIALLEPDYKRLIKILRNLDSDKYVLQSQETDYNYINQFPKFRMKEGDYLGNFPSRSRLYKWRGPGIDIFCFQHNSYIAAKVSQIIHAKLLNWTWKIQSDKKRWFVTKTMYGIYYCCMPLFWVLNVFRKPQEYHNALGQGWCHLYIKGILSPTIQVPFEDTMLPVPSDYDVFLTSLFGDWRTPPSKEEILSHGIHTKELFTSKNLQQ